jgi:hypothetical protein
MGGVHGWAMNDNEGRGFIIGFSNQRIKEGLKRKLASQRQDVMSPERLVTSYTSDSFIICAITRRLPVAHQSSKT